MRLILTTILVSFAIGYLAGGRLAGIATLKIQWPALALAGIALQFAPVAGIGGVLLLLFSFALLLVFVFANLRAPGFPLVVIGLALNFLVIAVNQGMPVTRHALIASDQRDTIAGLVRGEDTKHHFATDADEILFLGDVIPVGPPVRQAISVGDLFVHAGAAVFIVVGMRRGRRTTNRAAPTGAPGVVH